MDGTTDAIVVRGARVHNLKNITVSIPLNALTVVTGVSGSGKSSLAFDTVYAEGQRRYVESLSAYARQFLDRISRPDVDDIAGICPALAIRQKNYVRNPRSTVGTVTEINDYLRLLFARIGITRCHSCGRTVEKDSPGKIADFVLALPEGIRLYIAFRLNLSDPPATARANGRDSEENEDSSPAPGGRPGSSEQETRRPGQSLFPSQLRRGAFSETARRLEVALPGLQQQGFVRLLIDGRAVELNDALTALENSQSGEAHVIVDRLAVRPDVRGRLVDSLEVCGREADGRVEILLLTEDPEGIVALIQSRFPEVRWLRHPGGVLVKFSERFECQLCHITYEEPEPRLFSFNNPFGACPECQGFGNTVTLDLDRVVPDRSLSLREGAIHPWTKPRYRSFQNRLLLFAQKEAIPVDQPWKDLPESIRELIVRGKGHFPGVRGFFDYLEGKKYKMHVRIFISRYRGYATCFTCHGARLRREALDVFVGGKRIFEVSAMSVAGAHTFVGALKLSPHEAVVAGKILDEIRHRIDLLLRVGLEYLTLDRLSSTLSGGESQRIQLATSLGSMLAGALYVLDEPSIGLHPRDSARLIEILQGLKHLGNSVLVVEHDPEIMRAADHVIDLGPRAGEQGGEVVCEGSFEAVQQHPKSLTGRYLRGEARIPVPVFRRKANGRCLEVQGAQKHNLKNIDVKVPLDLFACITGVSGSGKSTLVHEVIYAAVKYAKGELKDAPEGYRTMKGAEHLSDVVLVDQSPIGRTPRSNPVTYVKAFDDIREIFAETRDAYARNLGPGHFSFNLPGGRCETCQGSGIITVEMQFLADVELTCDDCKGTRFKSSTLEVRFKGLNIAELLDLTVHEAIGLFAGHTRLVRKLRVLEEIGLGYLRLGQSATSLSGGEAQRVKLAYFIALKSAKRTLFIFDEPTTGLHFDDIRKLLAAFEKLISGGNSVLVIEHNLDVIKTADWVIDLGPEGGENGGHVVFEGTPDDLVSQPGSYTGRFLKRHLELQNLARRPRQAS